MRKDGGSTARSHLTRAVSDQGLVSLQRPAAGSVCQPLKIPSHKVGNRPN